MHLQGVGGEKQSEAGGGWAEGSFRCQRKEEERRARNSSGRFGWGKDGNTWTEPDCLCAVCVLHVQFQRLFGLEGILGVSQASPWFKSLFMIRERHSREREQGSTQLGHALGSAICLLSSFITSHDSCLTGRCIHEGIACGGQRTLCVWVDKY